MKDTSRLQMLICMLKNTNLEKIAKNCITKSRLYRQICTFVIKWIQKKEIKIICLRCAVILNLASEGELLESAHMHLTLALLSTVRRYVNPQDLSCVLCGAHRKVSGPLVRKSSKKAYY